jgi:hypothetical protein
MNSNEVHSAKIYQQEIQDLVEQMMAKGCAFNAHQDDVPFINFAIDKFRLGNILARSVKKGHYQLSPPVRRKILTDDKYRTVYFYTLTDKIIIKVFSRYLNKLFKPFISPSLFSYQKGRDAGMAIKQLSDFIRTMRKQRNLKGLYVLKIDLKSYNDSIYIAQGSPLWPRLMAFLENQLNPYEVALVMEMIRPSYKNDEGFLQCNIFGIPTGSPISNFVSNFYLANIDSIFTGMKDLFYARFCDDLLLCHPDAAVLDSLKERMNFELSKLYLRLNEKKSEAYFLSPAGNQGDFAHYKGKNSFNYLGYRMDGYGQVTLSDARKRKFLRAIFCRIRETYYTLKNNQAKEDTIIKIICKIVNQSFLEPDFLQNEVRCLTMQTDCHSQLQHLDYLIALNISMRVTGIQGVRAFVKLSYKTLRSTYGLYSLVNLRNQKFEINKVV